MASQQQSSSGATIEKQCKIHFHNIYQKRGVLSDLEMGAVRCGRARAHCFNFKSFTLSVNNGQLGVVTYSVVLLLDHSVQPSSPNCIGRPLLDMYYENVFRIVFQLQLHLNFAIAKPSNFERLHNFVKVKNSVKAVPIFFFSLASLL